MSAASPRAGLMHLALVSLANFFLATALTFVRLRPSRKAPHRISDGVQASVVTTTVASEAAAAALTTALVKQGAGGRGGGLATASCPDSGCKLDAARVKAVKVKSFFRYGGEMHSGEPEVRVTFFFLCDKGDHNAELVARVQQKHPYDTPMILVFPGAGSANDDHKQHGRVEELQVVLKGGSNATTNTQPGEDVAKALGRELVEKKLAACVQVAITREGAGADGETRLYVKTTPEKVAAAQEYLRAAEVAAPVTEQVLYANKAYHDWMEEQLKTF